MKLIPSWAYWLAIAGLLALAGWQQVNIERQYTKAADVKVAYQKSLATQRDALDKLRSDARAKEQMLVQHAATFNQEKQDEINRTEDALRAANDRLRNRPERPAAVAGGMLAPAASGQGITGAGLYREDGEFLVREAARANRQRAALAECYKRYDDAQVGK